MSNEDFLARWSRRKQEAQREADAPAPEQPIDPQGPTAPGHAQDLPPGEVDMSTLPQLDAITAATDVTAFLRKGIPPELTRAALRRAWAADPTIRDFVGLAENAWDFNDPHAMPGFGPLDCSEEQLAGLVDRIVGGVRSAAENLATAVTEKDGRQSAGSEQGALSESRSSAAGEPATAQEISRGTSPDQPPPASAAVQPESSPRDGNAQALLRRRTHGGALPR